MPNEVYRDEWDDVQVTDPMEFTHCRYTPVVTEVGGWGGLGLFSRGRKVLHTAAGRCGEPRWSASPHRPSHHPTPPSPASQDARDFGVDGYTLRLQRMDRKIKLFIVVTLYNEDYDELRKTLVGICDVRGAAGEGVLGGRPLCRRVHRSIGTLRLPARPPAC